MFYHGQHYFLVQYKRGSTPPPPPPHRHTHTDTHIQTHKVVDYPEPSFEIHVVKFLINEPPPPPGKHDYPSDPPPLPKKYSGSAHEDLFSSILKPID